MPSSLYSQAASGSVVTTIDPPSSFTQDGKPEEGDRDGANTSGGLA